MNPAKAFLALFAVGAVVGVPASATDIANPVYTARCQMCHQRDGAGLPGQFPRLAGRVDKIAATPDGRHYLVLVVLNGMVGGVTVDGRKLFGFMPSMATLGDADIASILNALGATGGKKPQAFTAAEVAKIRAQPRMSGTQVAAERARLVTAGLIP